VTSIHPAVGSAEASQPDRLGGLLHEYSHAARCDRISALTGWNGLASHDGRRIATGSYQGDTGDTGRMVDNTARDRAIYHALKAADEVAAALQAHLVEEHRADPDRTAVQNPATNSLKLLRQARERLGQGLRAVEAENIAESDKISLRNQ
jgi:hypothetical protein